MDIWIISGRIPGMWTASARIADIWTVSGRIPDLKKTGYPVQSRDEPDIKFAAYLAVFCLPGYLDNMRPGTGYMDNILPDTGYKEDRITDLSY